MVVAGHLRQGIPPVVVALPALREVVVSSCPTRESPSRRQAASVCQTISNNVSRMLELTLWPDDTGYGLLWPCLERWLLLPGFTGLTGRLAPTLKQIRMCRIEPTWRQRSNLLHKASGRRCLPGNRFLREYAWQRLPGSYRPKQSTTCSGGVDGGISSGGRIPARVTEMGYLAFGEESAIIQPLVNVEDPRRLAKGVDPPAVFS